MLCYPSSQACAQLFYANSQGAQIKISNSKNNAGHAASTNALLCEGKFINEDGNLRALKELRFDLPLSLTNKNALLVDPVSVNAAELKNDINFELTHSMVLPQLNIVHTIGYLYIQGARMRVEFQFNFVENNAETITLTARKMIRLSDFKREFISVFADDNAQDIIQMDLKLVIKNHNENMYLAAVVK